MGNCLLTKTNNSSNGFKFTSMLYKSALAAGTESYTLKFTGVNSKILYFIGLDGRDSYSDTCNISLALTLDGSTKIPIDIQFRYKKVVFVDFTKTIYKDETISSLHLTYSQSSETSVQPNIVLFI